MFAIPARALDTDEAAHRAQLAVYRRMTPTERVALMIRMSEDARAICSAGILARHPEYDASQVRFALLRLLLGDLMFRSAFAGAPLLSP